MAVPAPSASAWNTAQSDGQGEAQDRGIKDYQRIISERRDLFRACYDRSLAANPGIQGKVVLQFVLDPNGAVKEAFIDKSASDITLADLEGCMAAAVKSLSFPPSTRGMESTVRYPFTFTPRGERR